MKKGLILLLVIVAFSAMLLLTACGDSSNTPAETSNSIVGSWTYPNSTMTYVFNEDGTGSYYGRDFTYTTSGDQLSILYNGDTVSFDTTYTIENNKLNVRDSFGSDTIYNRD